MASATRCGSSQSTASGRPVATAQNPQLRVHTLPRIMKVAVPAPQHSPILGQLPLSQMVCSLCLDTMFLTFRYSSPMGSFTLSQSGLRGFSIAGVFSETILMLKPFFSEYEANVHGKDEIFGRVAGHDGQGFWIIIKYGAHLDGPH